MIGVSVRTTTDGFASSRSVSPTNVNSLQLLGDRHHRVADELLHRPPVALDLPPETSVVGADAGADVLGVGCLGSGGEADEVAEEDGHDLALLVERGRWLFGQRCPAERAEGELARELLTARRAGRHQPSLGAQAAGSMPEALSLIHI